MAALGDRGGGRLQSVARVRARLVADEESVAVDVARERGGRAESGV